MQEEVESKSITSGNKHHEADGSRIERSHVKIPGLRKEKKREKRVSGPVKPMGKQTVKQLVGQNQGVSNIEITDSNIKAFERVARKYGVDYAVKKDHSVSPPKYLVFFKASDTDALTSAFTEFTAKQVQQKEQAIYRRTNPQLADIVRAKSQDKVKNKEMGREL
jgi:hypothetical protein